jgi:hypothetical protein
MSDFYGIKPGEIPGFADTGVGRFMDVKNLPEPTVQRMLQFMEGCTACTRPTRSRSRYAFGMSPR